MKKKLLYQLVHVFSALLGMLTACTYLTGKWVQDHDREKKENRLLTNSYSAVVKGRQSVEIRPQVSGTITEILCERRSQGTQGTGVVRD